MVNIGYAPSGQNNSPPEEHSDDDCKDSIAKKKESGENPEQAYPYCEADEGGRDAFHPGHWKRFREDAVPRKKPSQDTFNISSEVLGRN